MSPQFASEDQYQAIEKAVSEGVAPDVAAQKEGTTLSALRRTDKHRHAEMLERGREARRAVVDERMDSLAKADDPNPTVVVAWAKANHEGYRETSKLEISGTDGGPIEVEGRIVAGLADVVAFARRIGASSDIGLDAGDPERALPPAEEVLPDPADDQRSAGNVPPAV